jgi:hypothetical protein
MNFFIMLLLVVGFGILVFRFSAWHQELVVLSPVNKIVILSPLNGEVFHPGETIVIRVSSPKEFQMRSLHVLGELGIRSDLNPPFEITIHIRKDADIKSHSLLVTADGPKSPSLAEGVEVVIEPSPDTRLESLQVDPKEISLSGRGMSHIILVRGQFSDGITRYVTFSRDTSINPLNEKVAVIEELPQGKYITAIAPGKTTIHIQYGLLSEDINVSVGIFELQGDLYGDGDIDQDDLNMLLAAKNTSSTGPGDPRDLNHDGFINEQDAQILTGLCSRPNCATHL